MKLRTLALLASLASASAFAADEPASFDIVIKDHVFTPAELTVPAGQKIKLNVKNQDSTPEEFESHSLHREKVIAGGASAVINVGPLKAGEYKFFGEFHEKTAQGKLIVK